MQNFNTARKLQQAGNSLKGLTVKIVSRQQGEQIGKLLEYQKDGNWQVRLLDETIKNFPTQDLEVCLENHCYQPLERFLKSDFFVNPSKYLNHCRTRRTRVRGYGEMALNLNRPRAKC